MNKTTDITTDSRIEKVIGQCELAIGEVWGDEFPEATTGDFPPEAAFALSKALESAVRTWLIYNTELLDD